ncbi:MAG: glycosyltransferase family 4 protein [Terracidiphilus sp.]|jgi:glycosyltransferase involved in cell wall biosynthesis
MQNIEKQNIRRVLYIDHTAEIGGGEIALLNLIRNIDSRKVAPIVLLFADGPLVEKIRPYAETHVLKLESRVAKIGKDTLGWKSLLKFRSAWVTVRHVFMVTRFAKCAQVEIVHTNSLKSDVIGGIAGKFAGIPVIWHVRDRIETDYLPLLVVKVFRFLCRTVPDFVIANSSATLGTLHLMGKRTGLAIASGIDTAAFTDVVHDGCDIDGLAQATRKKQGIFIGLIGRISPWKGQHIFIEAASLLHSQFPNVRFQIIGAPLFAEREYEQQLHELCERLGVVEAVEFVGFVENVPERIAQLDIVVHASTSGEPFGQVIIEGMAEQKPVVATNGGGVPEIVQDGVTGLLVPMGDAVAMANAIDFLLRNPLIAKEMGARGRERALSQFTIQMTARKVEAVYDQVLGVA